MTMELMGKVVLITGSSHGIGKETALAFSKEGCKVIVTYDQAGKEGKEVFEECSGKAESLLIHLDVTDDGSIEDAADKVLGRFGRIDILINNAGVIRWEELMEQDFDDIDAQVSVNLGGLIKTTRAFLPQLLRQGDGIIINIASGAGEEGFAGLTVYCATKFGVRGFTQSLAKELPDGIRAYSVNPGTTATRMTGFKGTAPSAVAGVIVATARESLGKKSGGDIDVWDYVE